MPESEAELPKLTLKDSVQAALGDDAKKKAAVVSVDEAIESTPLRDVSTKRTNVRMLFVTSNTDVLVPKSATQQHYADLAQFVGEIHLLVVKKGKGKTKIERPMRNVWVYQIYGGHFLRQVWEIRKASRQHLRFNGVARPDVLVATDPYTAGFGTWLAARTLRRPWQVQVQDNIFTLEWLAADPKNKRRKRVANFVLKRARSARVASTRIKEQITRHFKRLSDVEVLPHRFNLAAYKRETGTDIHERYHQYSFIMFAEGPYTAESHLHDVFAAVHQLLKNKRIALIVKGHGRAKSLFTDKAELLGITEQVVFSDPKDDVVSLYQSADVFIEASTDVEGDERVLHAVAASTPVVAYENDFRAGFLTHGSSAFLAEPEDSYQLGQHVRTLLNDSSRRAQFAMRAHTIIEEQIHEDVSTYYAAFRDSITTAITAPEEDAAAG